MATALTVVPIEHALSPTRWADRPVREAERDLLERGLLGSL